MCKFPFIHQGEKFDECTVAGGYKPPGWCATSTTSTGEWLTWDNCTGFCYGKFNCELCTYFLVSFYYLDTEIAFKLRFCKLTVSLLQAMLFAMETRVDH